RAETGRGRDRAGEDRRRRRIRRGGAVRGAPYGHRARPGWPRHARLHRRPHPLHRRWLPARVGRPARRGDSRGIHPPHPGIRQDAQAGGVDPGGDWDHTRWPGQRLPQHQWIDSVTPDNPVFVNRLDGHEALANAAAMRAAHVTKETPTPPGGEILRDPRTGEPTGIFKDGALDVIGRAVPEPSPERRDSALARALAHAASLGVTATAHMSASW